MKRYIEQKMIEAKPIVVQQEIKEDNGGEQEQEIDQPQVPFEDTEQPTKVKEILKKCVNN